MRVHWKRSTVINDFSGAAGLCVSAASSIGIGVFVICGYVAKHVAGPATVVSVLITAVIAVLTGLFYAELSQRLPRKASPYTFSNVCIGQLAAFLTGWTLILEYVVAIAVVAKSIGLYFDTLLNEVMQDALLKAVPIYADGFGKYFDFFGFGLALLMGLIFLFDLRRYHIVDNAALAICLAVIIFIITTGGFNANPVNWSPNTESDPQSGFLPFGALSIFRGAAMFSFAFIAVESLIRKKPSLTRSVSYTGLLSFAMVLLSLMGTAVVLTLMWPHNLMHKYIPIPHAFGDLDLVAAKSIVSIAAIVILSASLWTLMFPLKRQILALAEDGLLPFPSHNQRALGITLLLVVTICSLLAGLFSMGQLIGLLSVGTLLMFIVIAVAIVMLRFSHQLEIGSLSPTTQVNYFGGHLARPPSDDKNNRKDAIWMWLRQIAGWGEIRQRPTEQSFLVVKIVLTIQMVAMLGVALLIRFAGNHIYELTIWAVTSCAIFSLIAVLCLVIISLQPIRKNVYHFQAPLVSLTATVSVFACILLVVMLDVSAMIRFVVWMVVGVPVYVAANRRNKAATAQQEREQQKWRTGGISKIQTILNQEFEVKTVQPYVPYVVPTMVERQASSDQMVEIGSAVEDNEMQLKAYSVGEFKETPLNVAELEHKSRTPSPTSSLDDIVLASDIMDTLSERKEPNGKVYFVDEIKSEKSSIETAPLELENDYNSGDDDGPNKKEPQHTIAVIHIPQEEQDIEKHSQSIEVYEISNEEKCDSNAHSRSSVMTSVFILNNSPIVKEPTYVSNDLEKDSNNNDAISLTSDTHRTDEITLDTAIISSKETKQLPNSEPLNKINTVLHNSTNLEDIIAVENTSHALSEDILLKTTNSIYNEDICSNPETMQNNEFTSEIAIPSLKEQVRDTKFSTIQNGASEAIAVSHDQQYLPILVTNLSEKQKDEDESEKEDTVKKSTPIEFLNEQEEVNGTTNHKSGNEITENEDTSFHYNSPALVVDFQAHLKNNESDSDEEQPVSTLFHAESSSSSEAGTTAPSTPPDPDATSQNFKDRLSMLIGQNRSLDRQMSLNRKALPLIAELSLVDKDIKPHNDVSSPIPTSIGIPPPPLFDQSLYDSVNGVTNLPQSPDVFVKTRSDDENSPSADDDTTSSEDEPPERMMLSIRQKLENILSQGRPLRVSMIDGVARSVSTTNEEQCAPTHEAAEVPSEPNGEIPPIPPLLSTPEPMNENAHRVAFNDVLRSINRQISQQKPKVIRSSTPKPATIEDARLSLRHVDKNML